MKKQNILIGENGSVFEFTNRSAKINGKVQAGPVFVDGLGVGDVGNIVIRDRQQLAQDGVVIVVIALEKEATRSWQVRISFPADSSMYGTAKPCLRKPGTASNRYWTAAKPAM